MNDVTNIPQARPVQPAITGQARPVQAAITRVEALGPPPVLVELGAASQGALACRKTDGFAIASAVCGITGIVPFVTQIIGLVCGVVGLVRIRRARRRGLAVRGVGWAITGIASSGFVLLCWLAVFVGLSLASSTFANTAESLGKALEVAR